MSERVIPVELETGIPLTVVPHEDLPPAGVSGSGADWHHLVYPKSRKEMSSISGQALRSTRLEWVDIGDHRSFHHHFDQYMVHEWDFPQTNAERFGMTVLMAARYVPPRAISMATGSPKYTDVDDNMRQSFWDKGVLRVADNKAIFDFLKEYTLRQDFTGIVSESDIERFLFTDDETERVELGNKLIDMAALAATDLIRPVYKQAYKNRLILPQLPSEPSEFITTNPVALGTEKRMRKTRTLLRKNLAAQVGIELLDVA